MNFERIAHMEYAKLCGGSARYDLTRSGIPGVPAGTFAPFREPVEPADPRSYGYPELAARVARRYDVPRRRVLIGAGTSLANFLLMAAVLRTGDEVLVEHPTYEPLRAVPATLGARVIRFTRPMERAHRPDLEEIESRVTPATRLLVLSNLHNPSGAALGEETLAGLSEIARRRRLRVLVDEVYLDFLLAPGESPAARSVARRGPEFLVTSSLTKTYGLGGLRAGWGIAEPGIVERALRIADSLGVNESSPGVRLAARSLDGLEALAERSRRITEGNRAVFSEWLAGRPDLTCSPPAAGIVALVRLPRGVSARALAAHMARRHRTLVLPGEFFECPGHLRIGLGLPPGDLPEALARLGRGLDELASCDGGAAGDKVGP